MKILLLGVELLLAEGRTDRQTRSFACWIAKARDTHHTLRICNTYYFSTINMFSRMCFDVTFLSTLPNVLEYEHDFICGIGTHLIISWWYSIQRTKYWLNSESLSIGKCWLSSSRYLQCAIDLHSRTVCDL